MFKSAFRRKLCGHKIVGLIVLAFALSSPLTLHAHCNYLLKSLHGAQLVDLLKAKGISLLEPAERSITIDLFDWDDNVVYMTSARIFLMDLDTGKEVAITTEEYAAHKTEFGKDGGPYPRQVLFDYLEHPNGELERITIEKRWEVEPKLGKPGEYENVKLVEGSWFNFRDVPDPDTFVKQVAGALQTDSRWRAPMWFEFVSSLKAQDPFHWVGILTTRGHSPENIIRGINTIRATAPFEGHATQELIYPIYNPKFPKDLGSRPHERKWAVVEAYLDLLSILPAAKDGKPHRIRFSDDDKLTIAHVLKHLEVGRAAGRWKNIQTDILQTNLGGETPARFVPPIPSPRDDILVSPQGETIEKLRTLLPPNPFFIPAKEAVAIAAQLGLNMDQLLMALVPLAKELSVPLNYETGAPPISRYRVGVAGMSEEGNIYLGVNLEFPGLPLFSTIHGEQFLFTNMFFHREKSLHTLALSAEPCGHCRQWMTEALGLEKLRILVPGKAANTLGGLLPHSFGPANLGMDQGMLDSPPQKLAPENEELLKDKLHYLAFEAAEISYTPYSKNAAGIAVELEDGTQFMGSSIENAAFNPSITPLHAALINMRMAGKDPRMIRKVVIAEIRPEASSGQREYIEILLRSLGVQAEVSEMPIISKN